MSRPPPSQRPSLLATLANLGARVPAARKLRLMLRNYWLRLYRQRTCCGHPGEPGC